MVECCTDLCRYICHIYLYNLYLVTVVYYLYCFHSHVAIDCGTLPAPANGVVRFNPGTTFSSTASFQCKRGFILLGNKQRFCQASSQWSGSQPICQSMSGVFVNQSILNFSSTDRNPVS